MDATLKSMLNSPEIHKWKDNAARYVKESDLFSMPERVVDLIENSKYFTKGDLGDI
jgi:hypothetical protein